MVKEMPSSTVVNRDEECLKKSLMEVVKSDSSNLCRLCLSKEQKLTRAFSDERGIDDALLKKIFDCTTVKVKLKSVFPSAICAVCDLKLNEFYKFREKCIENDTFLHNLLDDRVASASEVDQSVPIVEKQPKQHHNRTSSKGGSGGSGSGGTHVKEFQTEQQAATSTTSIPEAQKRNNSEMMAIALNQLSSFGLRPLQELMVERNGTERHALLDDSSSARLPTNSGGNVVSSSSCAPSQAHDSTVPPPLISSLDLVEQTKRQLEQQERTFALATLEMAGLQALHRTGTEGGSVGGSGGAGAGSTSGGKFECTVCRRMFRNAYTLRRHTNLHTETNLFPCEYCGKKFNDRSNWKIHQRTHTGDNLYTCLVCLKTFISPSTLKYHRRSHRRLESFDCRLCPGTFANYDLLEEHARNMHQDMQDMQPEEPMIDAASFVKIELEDGELSSSMAGGDVGTTTTTRLQHGNEEEEEDEEEQEGQESRERRQPVDSSRVEELHLAELYQTQQQVLELLEKQLQGGHVTVEPRIGAMAANGGGMGEQTTHQGGMAVKREMLGEHQQQYQQQRQHEVDVKEEPLDDSMEIDPSELLQQAMEEAGDGNEDSEGGDKQFSSSSSDDSSSPSTMILFRCDYCMKIFHFLDELNAHMLLHNGAKKGNAATGPIMLGTAAASNTPGPVPTTPSSKPMPLLTLVRPESSIPLLANGYATKAESKSPRSKPKRRRATTITVAPEEQTKSIPDAVSDSLPPVPAPPPEHVCSKCPKMFRTEELKRVHEATHADDEQAHKVRSCRICNKLFKCELNLLAHMRKHSLSIHQTGLAGEGAESGAGDSSGNDESCSSSSNVGGGGVLTAVTSHELTAAHNQQHFSPDESDEGESPPGAPPSDVASPESGEPAGEGTDSGSLAVLSRSAFRKCEICAITFKDTVALDQHMLCHFERKEAIAFVPQTDRPFQCTECHKSFKRKDYLLIHIRTHTGERRYKCDLCSSAFVHPSNLITHRKLHSNERPYQCTLCGATFKLFAGLKIHRRRCEQKLPKGGSQENVAGTAVLSFGPDTAELHDSGTTAEQLLSAGSVHYPF